VRAFSRQEWAEAIVALLGSFVANWYISQRGPKPTWPALSMLFSVVGLSFAAWSFRYE